MRKYKIYVTTVYSDGMCDELDGVEYTSLGDASDALNKALDDPDTGHKILTYCIAEVEHE